MFDTHIKLARLLRSQPEVLQSLDEKMISQFGRKDAFVRVVGEIDLAVTATLKTLGLGRKDSAETVFKALTSRLQKLDAALFQVLGEPNLARSRDAAEKLRKAALGIFTPPKGFFIKRERIAEILDRYPPETMLSHFGYANVKELLDKEGLSSVVSGLRFTQSAEWMHAFFEKAYAGLTAADFEERDIEFLVLDTKWLDIAQKFQAKKYHNVSHLKEYGIIFVIPDPIDQSGETMRMFTLILHYLHEVPFYSGLFRRFAKDADFVPKLQSLLRGDVLSAENCKLKIENSPNTWLVIQRYLAKDNVNDPRLAMPHVNPEAEHWFRVAEDFGKISALIGDGGEAMAEWQGLDHVGGFFKSADGTDKLVSFALLDLIMALVQRGQAKYLYHQQEALWNRVFVEYIGRERMGQLIEENIVRGCIEL